LKFQIQRRVTVIPLGPTEHLAGDITQYHEEVGVGEGSGSGGGGGSSSTSGRSAFAGMMAVDVLELKTREEATV